VSEGPRRRPLPQLGGAQQGLDGATIMDRALAAAHGARYVRLAAFAIDVDRVYALAATSAELPFAWEVFAVEQYLLGALEGDDPSVVALLEDTCLSILAQPPDEQGFGSLLVFAVRDAVSRGLLPQALGRAFASWRSPQKQLVRALDALWRERDAALRRIAEHCVRNAPAPGLAPPTAAALEAMRDGTWPPRP